VIHTNHKSLKHLKGQGVVWMDIGRLCKRLKSLLPKPIKGEGVSSLNQEIGFGFTCLKKDLQPIEALNCILEEMNLSKSLRTLMIMLIKWIFQVSTMSLLLSIFFYLSPSDAGDDLRKNLFEEMGNDGNGGLNLKDPLQVPDRPITRSRSKKIKEAMQGLVQSTWAEFANLSSKTPKFKLGLKEEEPTLIHVV